MTSEGEHILERELEILNHYISFQQLIYPGRFDYDLIIDPDIDIRTKTIPPMLVQPFVENAIRHGLLLKKGHGHLKVSILTKETSGMEVFIEDDGVGIEKAMEILLKSPMRYKSRGQELTLKRVKLMNEIGYDISVNTESSGDGTRITIKINQHAK